MPDGDYRPPRDHYLTYQLVHELAQGRWTQQELQEQFGFTMTVDPLHLGLVAVTFNQRGSYERFVCDLVGGRCSCGVDNDTCVHIAAAEVSSLPPPSPLYPSLRRRGRKGTPLPRPPSLES